MSSRLIPAACVAALGLALAAPAWAGPPYVTDDPAPTDFGHWEIYNFATGVHVPRDTAGEAGLDLNYGAAPGLQLTVVLPLGFDDSGGDARVGRGIVELAAKYRFLRQSEGTLTPDLAVFPRLFVPTSSQGLGSSRASLLLPIWAEKDVGKWSLFGGGGYDINPGPGNLSYWTGGLALTRTVSDRFAMGAEVYHHGPDAVGAGAFTGVNLGLTYKASEHWSILASGGPGVQNARDQGRYDFYLALKADY